MPSEPTQVALCVPCFMDTRVKEPWNTRTGELWGCGDVSALPGTTVLFHGDSF